MLPSRVFLLIPLIILFGVSSAWAQPYERTQYEGLELCRGDRTVTYAMTTSGGHPTAEERAAVTAAFNTWNQAVASCSDLVFTPGEDVPHPAPRPLDGKMLVTFRQVNCPDIVPDDDACWQNESCHDKYDCWPFAPRDVVDETSYFRVSTGEILGTEISLNNSNGMLTTLDGPPCDEGVIEPGCVIGDVQSLVTRSIGEGLGLALLTRTDSTMSRVLPWGDTQKRIIDPGTLQGICETYPRGLPTPGCIISTDGGVPDGGDGVPSGDGGVQEADGGVPDAGDSVPDGDGGAPSKSGCTTTSSVPLLGALMLLLGARRTRQRSRG
ncbi:hypothetical protein MXAN_5248 [Myxococcus xanthus DK 1622]|uniref:Uncharacterized protein n=1 Tax=Myxococcus xanthus (strain DK1622) TaxID=246197 RepID=Q1D1S3_MYXXD|nr:MULTISPECIES: MYXO-CTERM-anchored inactivated metalloprotease [Myxococcus]ABF92261.1 hypothetical protein MXAN_5248 [Myxococcus xanthus DK 1622]NOJ53640.1 hypothetical protein [Myxococcus xanthus]QPM77737.1 hypothetical protein I5Q59_25955 [Myxococcus xanthus]QVW66805.1 hypothetical protein JTM82_31305 [Myxococcus xanthus DZ2]QZZ52912.1 hypothetical protein MyxoNM_27235 [Myxococcus xanthus]